MILDYYVIYTNNSFKKKLVKCLEGTFHSQAILREEEHFRLAVGTLQRLTQQRASARVKSPWQRRATDWWNWAGPKCHAEAFWRRQSVAKNSLEGNSFQLCSMHILGSAQNIWCFCFSLSLACSRSHSHTHTYTRTHTCTLNLLLGNFWAIQTMSLCFPLPSLISSCSYPSIFFPYLVTQFWIHCHHGSTYVIAETDLGASIH